MAPLRGIPPVRDPFPVPPAPSPPPIEYDEPEVAITFTFNFSADGEYLSADVRCPHEGTGCGGLGPLDDLKYAAGENNEVCSNSCTWTAFKELIAMLPHNLHDEAAS